MDANDFRPPKRPLLKPLLLICCVVASLTVGVPLAMLGMFGLAGRVADAEYAVNLRFGLQSLAAAGCIWGMTYASYLWTTDKLPTRFSMRFLLGAMTCAAILLGWAAWALSSS